MKHFWISFHVSYLLLSKWACCQRGGSTWSKGWRFSSWGGTGYFLWSETSRQATWGCAGEFLFYSLIRFWLRKLAQLFFDWEILDFLFTFILFDNWLKKDDDFIFLFESFSKFFILIDQDAVFEVMDVLGLIKLFNWFVLFLQLSIQNLNFFCSLL